LTARDPLIRLDKQQALLYRASQMLKCPHCGKGISDRLIVQRAGQIGGKRTAKRGPEYFRQIAAMRKEFKGGRPKKAE
jgi:hypothetical protein